jgi:hypothetical protein
MCFTFRTESCPVYFSIIIHFVLHILWVIKSQGCSCSNQGFFSLFQASIDYDDMSDQHISVSFHKDKARLLDED